MCSSILFLCSLACRVELEVQLAPSADDGVWGPVVLQGAEYGGGGVVPVPYDDPVTGQLEHVEPEFDALRVRHVDQPHAVLLSTSEQSGRRGDHALCIGQRAAALAWRDDD